MKSRVLLFSLNSTLLWTDGVDISPGDEPAARVWPQIECKIDDYGQNFLPLLAARQNLHSVTDRKLVAIGGSTRALVVEEHLACTIVVIGERVNLSWLVHQGKMVRILVDFACGSFEPLLISQLPLISQLVSTWKRFSSPANFFGSLARSTLKRRQLDQAMESDCWAHLKRISDVASSHQCVLMFGESVVMHIGPTEGPSWVDSRQNFILSLLSQPEKRTDQKILCLLKDPLNQTRIPAMVQKRTLSSNVAIFLIHHLLDLDMNLGRIIELANHMHIIVANQEKPFPTWTARRVAAKSMVGARQLLLEIQADDRDRVWLEIEYTLTQIAKGLGLPYPYLHLEARLSSAFARRMEKFSGAHCPSLQPPNHLITRFAQDLSQFTIEVVTRQQPFHHSFAPNLWYGIHVTRKQVQVVFKGEQFSTMSLTDLSWPWEWTTLKSSPDHPHLMVFELNPSGHTLYVWAEPEAVNSSSPMVALPKSIQDLVTEKLGTIGGLLTHMPTRFSRELHPRDTHGNFHVQYLLQLI